jgi:iron complex outermembrane receptor protein
MPAFETPNAFLDQDGCVLLDASIVYNRWFRVRFYNRDHGKNLLGQGVYRSRLQLVAGGTGAVHHSCPRWARRHAYGFLWRPAAIFVTGEVRF